MHGNGGPTVLGLREGNFSALTTMSALSLNPAITNLPEPFISGFRKTLSLKHPVSLKGFGFVQPLNRASDLRLGYQFHTIQLLSRAWISADEPSMSTKPSKSFLALFSLFKLRDGRCKMSRLQERNWSRKSWAIVRSAFTTPQQAVPANF